MTFFDVLYIFNYNGYYSGLIMSAWFLDSELSTSSLHKIINIFKLLKNNLPIFQFLSNFEHFKAH